MAFKRLTVERSPGAVWFGALVLVASVAGYRAASSGFRTVCIAFAVLGAYCVVRGLYGAWWRELRIDHDARTLALGTGKVVALDSLGALSIADRELRAEHVGRLYFSPFPYELESRRQAIEHALGRGGRRLPRLRRLAYHRSWGLFVFTLVGFALLTTASIETGLGDRGEYEYTLMALAGYALCIVWFRRALFGSFSKRQLFVDPAAGLVVLDDGRVVRLDELGELTIVERVPTYTGRRHQLHDFELHAANVEGVLYMAWERPKTELRRDALATAVLHNALRRVLEAPVLDGDVFRSGIDPAAEVARIAGDSPHRAAALRALTRDPDATIRQRATALL